VATIKTVVFDIGNVVWRFHPAFDGVFRIWAQLMGINLHQFRLNYYEKDGLYRKFEVNTLTLNQWFPTICPNIKPQVFIDVLNTKLSNQLYFSKYLNNSTISLVSKIRLSGLTAGCLSNTENFFYPYFKKNFVPLFDYSITSWQSGFRKPDPAIYHEIYKHGKFLPSEILFIDDVPANISAARKQGISAILFTNITKLKHDLKNFLPSLSH